MAADSSREPPPEPRVKYQPRQDGAAAEQKLAERAAQGMLALDAFSAWLGLEPVEIRPRGCRLRMTVRPDMLNGFGVCHGGVTFALADSALAFASNTHGRVTVSVESSISYPAPILAGEVLEAEAVEESATRKLAFYTVKIMREDGTPAALFRGTVYRTLKPHRGLEDDLAAPPPATDGLE